MIDVTDCTLLPIIIGILQITPWRREFQKRISLFSTQRILDEMLDKNQFPGSENRWISIEFNLDTELVKYLGEMPEEAFCLQEMDGHVFSKTRAWWKTKTVNQMEGISMRFHRFFVCCWLALTLLPRQEGYITMSNIAFVPFSCFSHPYGGSSLLTTTNILCGSGDHGFMQVYGVILGTLPWSVVFFFFWDSNGWISECLLGVFFPAGKFWETLGEMDFPFFAIFLWIFPSFFIKKKTPTPSPFRGLLCTAFLTGCSYCAWKAPSWSSKPAPWGADLMGMMGIYDEFDDLMMAWNADSLHFFLQQKVYDEDIHFQEMRFFFKVMQPMSFGRYRFLWPWTKIWMSWNAM